MLTLRDLVFFIRMMQVAGAAILFGMGIVPETRNDLSLLGIVLVVGVLTVLSIFIKSPANTDARYLRIWSAILGAGITLFALGAHLAVV